VAGCAWLTVIGFCFVIARFGLLLQIVAMEKLVAAQHACAGMSAALGIVSIATGTLIPRAACDGLRHSRGAVDHFISSRRCPS
jgi:hypothetical protein